MLGDNAEKSKNPLKKAMRRRNAKTVTFASPTYFEASDIDYSTEEEDEDEGGFLDEETEVDTETRDVDETIRDESMAVEPLRPKPQVDTTTISEEEERQESPDKARTSDEFFEQPGMLPYLKGNLPWANLIHCRNSQSV